MGQLYQIACAISFFMFLVEIFLHPRMDISEKGWFLWYGSSYRRYIKLK